MRQKTALLLLILIGLVVYMNSLLNGFVGDDFYQIIRNPLVHNVTNIPTFFFGGTYYTGEVDKLGSLYYRPIMISLFSIIYHFYKDLAVMYHLLQVILHIVNAMLVFTLLRKFFKIPVAFIASLIFLVHPINNEAVVYIANLQDVLFVLFGLLALLVLNKTEKSMLLSGLFLLLSLFSKESGILFVILSVLYYFLFIKSQTWKFAITAFSALLLYGLFRFGIAGVYSSMTLIAPIAHLTFFERMLTVPKIIQYYMTQFFFPLHITGGQFWVVKTVSFERFIFPLILSIFLFSACSFAGYHFYKKKKKLFPVLLFFTLFFVLNLGMHLQLIPIDSTVADRWFYASTIGLVGIGAVLFENLHLKKTHRPLILFPLIAIVILFSIRTIIRNFDWKDEITLYSRDIKHTEDTAIIANSLGRALIEDGQYRSARPYIEESIRQYPYFGNLNNMAVIALSEKNIPLAKKYLEQALQLENNYLVYENYSNLLIRYDDPRNARNFTKKALERYPGNPKLWRNIAVIEDKLGNKKAAKEAEQRVSSLLKHGHKK